MLNKKQRLALFNSSKKDELKKTNPAISIADGAIYGASLGFVAPALISATAPKRFEKAIKQKKIFGKDISNQLIQDDTNRLYQLEKDKLDKKSRLGEKILQKDYDDALNRSKKLAHGYVKKPMNTNLSVQTGLGRWGAVVGAGLVGGNLIRKQLKKRNDKNQK